MYIVYLRHFANQTFSLVQKALQGYLSSFGKKDFLFSSPGYLSRSTKCPGFQVESVIKLFSNNYGIFSYSMNPIVKNSAFYIHNSKHYVFLDDFQNSQVSYIQLNCRQHKAFDHAKQILFYDDEDSNLQNTLYKIKKNRKAGQKIYLPSNKIHAALIGSSNQNDTTYFCRNGNQKGESDVFMFDEYFVDSLHKSIDSLVTNILGEENSRKVVVCKSISNYFVHEVGKIFGDIEIILN